MKRSNIILLSIFVMAIIWIFAFYFTVKKELNYAIENPEEYFQDSTSLQIDTVGENVRLIF